MTDEMADAVTNATSDDALMAHIGRVVARVDPAPDEAYEIGRQAFLSHRLDEELADLVADSRAEAGSVRSWGEDVRLLTYRCPGLTIEVQVSREGPGFHVLGTLVRGSQSPNGGRIHLETADGPAASAVIDNDDRFEFTSVPESLVRLRIEPAGRSSVTTAWLEM